MNQRNPLLNGAMYRALRLMQITDDHEMVVEGKAVYVGCERIGFKTFLRLLQLCLIHKEQWESNGLERYTLYPCGKKILEDVKYIPLILRVSKDER